MWILRLNPVTASAETVVPVAWAESRKELEDFLEHERVDSYKDGRFTKRFRKGGPLEMYNPPDDNGEAWVDTPAIIDVGTVEEWKENAAKRFYDLQNQTVDVSGFVAEGSH